MGILLGQDQHFLEVMGNIRVKDGDRMGKGWEYDGEWTGIPWGIDGKYMGV